MKNFIEILGGLSMLLFIALFVCGIMNLLWFKFDLIWFKLFITTSIIILMLYLIYKLFYDDTI